MKYEAFFFDMDGTIIESGYGVMEGLTYALAKFGIDAGTKEDMRKCIGPPLFYSFTEYYGLSEDDANTAIKYYRDIYNKELLFKAPLYDGFYEMVEYLHDTGAKLSVVTSKPVVQAKQIAEHHGIMGFFDYVSAPTEAESANADKTQLINQAIEALGIEDKKTVVMVGDRKYDILGAVGAGVDSIGAVYGYGSREELREAGATYLVDRPIEVKDYAK